LDIVEIQTKEFREAAELSHQFGLLGCKPAFAQRFSCGLTPRITSRKQQREAMLLNGDLHPIWWTLC